MPQKKSPTDSTSGEQKWMKAGLSPLGIGKELARDKAHLWDCLTKITLAMISPEKNKPNQRNKPMHFQDTSSVLYVSDDYSQLEN